MCVSQRVGACVFCECDCVVPGCVYVCLVFDVCEPVNVSVCVWVCVSHITCVCVGCYIHAKELRV